MPRPFPARGLDLRGSLREVGVPDKEECPFCPMNTRRVFYKDDLVVGFWDGFPVAPGHALLVTRRHVSSWFETTAEEQRAMLVAIEHAREAISRRHAPDGFNIGINDGAAAGQTVPHLHVHVIPRYAGDVDDPRGGIRWVLPGRAPYWSNEGAG